SQTLAALPNSRLKTPMVPGPQTSWVMRTSTFTHTLSPAWTCALPLARASTFSVRVIRGTTITPHHTRAQMDLSHELGPAGRWGIPPFLDLPLVTLICLVLGLDAGGT